MAGKNKYPKGKHPGGRHRTGYDVPRTVNYKKEECQALQEWGQKQVPEMNFSDVVHLMTADFIKAHPSDETLKARAMVRGLIKST